MLVPRGVDPWVPMEGLQMSNEQRAPGWLGYLGDEILPSYVGMIS